ncbi:MAG: hypothetical protein KAT56_01910 [Sedimentisphaerales bacterium]|nr:hypothetical protein [Sedimentisphaerales bacterium]
MIKQRQNIHLRLRENEDRITNLEKQLQANQKLSLIGTTACLAAHEFNNMLALMINYSELALKHEDDAALMRKALEKVIKHGNNAALIIQSMLGQVRNQSQQYETVQFTHLIRECFQSLARDYRKDNIEVKITVPEDLCLSVVRGQIQQVLLNLIINARQAILPRSGTLTIDGQYQADGTAIIKITDTGCGIEPEKISRIFEPFFSTKTNEVKPDMRGTGLGLSVCKDIIESHNGTINVESEPDRGTTFTIILPAHSSVTSPTNA